MMQPKREIIVVAPDQYKDLARKLAHEISKIEGFNGAVWNPKQFDDNEFHMGAHRHVISLGNSNESPISKSFLSFIGEIENFAGSCFCYDGTKAIIYGDGNLEHADKLNEFIISSKAKMAGVAGLGASVGAGISGVILAANPLAIVYGPAGYFFYRMMRKSREKKLRLEQTKYALHVFLTNHFDSWQNINKG